MPHSRVQIEVAARQLHQRLWARREEIYGRRDVERPDSVPFDLRLVAERILGFEFHEVDEIPAELRGDVPASHCAGVLDRGSRSIYVATRGFPRSMQRYTAAHELGHVLLHPELPTLHRDRPMAAAEREVPARPRVEDEADIFASVFLIPERLLGDAFSARFGKAMSSAEAEELAHWLSRPNRRVSADILRDERRYRARMVAQCETFRGKPFMALEEMFGVSNEAMAIRLEECGWVP